MRFGLAALAIALTIGAACGGGSGSTDVAGGGIGGTGISSGSVTGFGSYFVTGTEWALAPTGVVEIDGRTSSPMRSYDERDLRLGMYLRVDGERSEDGATATSTYIRYDEAIEGAVEQTPVDGEPDQKQLTILGQSVLIDDGITVFDGTSFTSLAAGDVVEMSGPVDSDGKILATRVEHRGMLVLGSTQVEFKGAVANLGGGAFDVGPVTVHFDCATTTDCSAFPLGSPTEGSRVEIEGVQSQAGAAPEVEAAVLRPYTPFASQVGDVDNLEVEGVIDDFAGLGSFTVNGVSVDASSAQRDPDDASLYGDGVYVEAEGNRTGGVLRARILELRDGAARVSARIAGGGLDRAAQNEIVLLAEGTPGQPGFQELVVRVDASTRIEDRSSAGDADLKLSELLVGDFLEVRGVVAGAGRIRASEVRREDIGDVRLRGPVESIDTDPGDGSLGYSTLGIYVELVQGTTSVPGGDVDAFLGGLAIGDLLEARDDQDGSEERFDIADEVAAP